MSEKVLVEMDRSLYDFIKSNVMFGNKLELVEKPEPEERELVLSNEHAGEIWFLKDRNIKNVSIITNGGKETLLVTLYNGFIWSDPESNLPKFSYLAPNLATFLRSDEGKRWLEEQG